MPRKVCKKCGRNYESKRFTAFCQDCMNQNNYDSKARMDKLKKQSTQMAQLIMAFYSAVVTNSRAELECVAKDVVRFVEKYYESAKP